MHATNAVIAELAPALLNPAADEETSRKRHFPPAHLQQNISRKDIAMKKLTLTLVALATITLLSLSASAAQAAGFRVYVSTPARYRPIYPAYTARPIYYTPGFGASTVVVGRYHADVWHDTPHLHYRPAAIVPHGDHLDYVPERYEVHHTGHWDHVH
jgi:hypothetical protein